MNVNGARVIRILLSAGALMASLLAARADVVAAQTGISRDIGGLTFSLGFTAPTPFRAYTLDNPRRLVLDLGDVALAGFPQNLAADIPEISAVRYGLFRLGEARVVLDLAAPLVIENARSLAGPAGGATITIRLARASVAGFQARSVLPDDITWATPPPDPEIQGGASQPLIAIDAGHGGPDNGAVADGVQEKDLTLQLALRLRDVLLETGLFRVVLTRDTDVFVTLGERVEIARRAGAVAFISLHADIVTRGRARGTTVFSLSEADADQEAVTIATLENRSDLVAGISVEGEDDQITSVLLQMAHRETDALSNRFADVMAEALWYLNDADIKSRRMAGGFRVLRAPDMPSVLIETGFMSDERDLKLLQDPDWQLSMAETLSTGLQTWLAVEADMRGLLRNSPR